MKNNLIDISLTSCISYMELFHPMAITVKGAVDIQLAQGMPSYDPQFTNSKTKDMHFATTICGATLKLVYIPIL